MYKYSTGKQNVLIFSPKVKHNRILCMTILGIWSWSLIQFALVLTATKARKDLSGIVSRKFPPPDDETCCTPDVYGIVISIFLQDAPFLVLRMLLIFKYGVVSYTNMFFTCKNTLVIMLLLYRLIVVQWERRAQRMQSAEYKDMSESSSRVRLVPNSYSVDTYYSLVNKSKLNVKDVEIHPVKNGQGKDKEPNVEYIIKRHYSFDKLPFGGSTSSDMCALQECFDIDSDDEAFNEVDDDDDDDIPNKQELEGYFTCDGGASDDDSLKSDVDEKPIGVSVDADDDNDGDGFDDDHFDDDVGNSEYDGACDDVRSSDHGSSSSGNDIKETKIDMENIDILENKENDDIERQKNHVHQEPVIIVLSTPDEPNAAGQRSNTNSIYDNVRIEDVHL